MNNIFLILVLTFFSDPVTGPIDGYVLTENGNPIEGVHVFFRGHLQSGVTTNSKGYFSLSTKSTPLLFSHIGYEEKEINLQTLERRIIKVVLKEDKILLDEVVILPSKIIDVTSILELVKENYYKNSYSKNSTYSVKGEHLAIEGSDTLILLKSPFFLKFKNYPKLDADSEISLSMRNNSIFNKGKTFYTLFYKSEIFLKNSFRWLDVKNLNFIAKSKKYDYKVLESDTSYIISFLPLKNKPFLYYGEMEILKENYALKNFNIKLIFNRKNYDAVISSDKKRPGSRYYYESTRINIGFKKDKISQLYCVERMSLSIYMGRVIEKTNKRIIYTVNTDLQFKKTNQYVNPNDEIDLINYLYIDAEKLKR